MSLKASSYLKSLAVQLLFAPQHKIIKSALWASDFPKSAGVYIIRKDSAIIYVGETGSIQGRMKDLCRTLNHTARRTIGKELFVNHPEYVSTSSKIKFSDNLEELVNEYFAKHLTVSWLVVELGRVELEELICKEYQPIHNKKFGRNKKRELIN